MDGAGVHLVQRRRGKRMRNAEKWYLTRQTFPELLHRNVVRFPERPAQYWREGDDTVHSITYGAMGEKIREIAAGLIAMGVAKGDRIAIMAPTLPCWLWADYGILCAGGITVSVYPTLSAREVAFQLSDSGSRILMVADPDGLARAFAAGISELDHIIYMGREGLVEAEHRQVMSLSGLQAEGRALLRRDPLLQASRWRSLQPDDKMTIVYTSGTTGRPRGVVHTHASMTAACLRDLAAIPQLTEKDLLLSFLPLAHTFERQCGHGTAMFAAIPIAYGSPETLREDLALFRPTYFMSVPRIYERLFKTMEMRVAGTAKERLFAKAMQVGARAVRQASDADGRCDMEETSCLKTRMSGRIRLLYRLWDVLVYRGFRQAFGGRLRFVFSAAGSLSEDLCRLYLAMGIRIFEGYGATETCNTVTLNPSHAVLPGSVGPSCKGVTGRVDADGEWLVKTDTLFDGYWNRPEETARAFTSDGFYRTGDIVEVLDCGYLKIVARKKGLIVLDTGKNVPAEKITRQFRLSRYIDTVVPVGDDKPFLALLVVPDFDAIVRRFEENGILYPKEDLVYASGICVGVGKDFIRIPELKALFDMEIAAANAHLEQYERIWGFAVLRHQFSVATGELTPTLKVKRYAVLDKYRDEIAEIYAA